MPTVSLQTLAFSDSISFQRSVLALRLKTKETPARVAASGEVVLANCAHDDDGPPSTPYRGEILCVRPARGAFGYRVRSCLMFTLGFDVVESIFLGDVAL